MLLIVTCIIVYNTYIARFPSGLRSFTKGNMSQTAIKIIMIIVIVIIIIIIIMKHHHQYFKFLEKDHQRTLIIILINNNHLSNQNINNNNNNNNLFQLLILYSLFVITLPSTETLMGVIIYNNDVKDVNNHALSESIKSELNSIGCLQTLTAAS